MTTAVALKSKARTPRMFYNEVVSEKFNISSFNNKEWLAWEQSCCPLFLGLTFDSCIYGLTNATGLIWPQTILEFREGQGRWLNKWSEFKSLGSAMLAYLQVETNKRFFTQSVDKAERELLELSNKIIRNQNLQMSSDKHLISLLDNFQRAYHAWYGLTCFCEPIEIEGQRLITEYACSGEVTISRDDLRDFIFSTATRSFVVEILEDLSICARLLKKAVESSPEFRGVVLAFLGANSSLDSNRICQLLGILETSTERELEALYAKLCDHAMRFHWKGNNYAYTKMISPGDVLAEMLALQDLNFKRLEEHYRKQLLLHENASSMVQAQKEKYMAIFPEDYKRIIELVNEVGCDLREQRKKTAMIANSAVDKIAREISTMAGCDLRDVHMLMPGELSEFPRNPNRYLGKIAARKEHFLVHLRVRPQNEGSFSKRENSVKYIESPAVSNYLEQINPSLQIYSSCHQEKRKVLRGIVAYGARNGENLSGRVKIVKSPLTESISPDEILVAASTTPDFYPLICKAKAIITNWGGQTSHAAICARQLQKPCIVGATNASHILKNGSKIEINFDHGIISLIND